MCVRKLCRLSLCGCVCVHTCTLYAKLQSLCLYMWVHASMLANAEAREGHWMFFSISTLFKKKLYFIMFLYAGLGDGGDGGGMVYVQKFKMSSPSIFKLVLVQVSRLVGQVPLLPEPSP